MRPDPQETHAAGMSVFGSCLAGGSRECSGAGLTRTIATSYTSPPTAETQTAANRRGEAATGKSRGSSLWTHAYGPYGRPPLAPCT